MPCCTSSQPRLSLHPVAKAPPVWVCLHSPGLSCGSALLYLLGGGALLSGGQGPWRTCEASTLCCALCQQNVHELPRALFMSPTWKTQCLHHSLNHCRFLGRLFFILRKRLLYQLSGYLILQHLTLFDLQSLVSQLLLSVETHLESVYVAIACPKCPAIVVSAPASLTAV